MKLYILINILKSSKKLKWCKALKWKAIGIWIIFFFVVVLIFSALSQPLLHQSWGLKIVQGPSMEPIFHSGDLVFVVPQITWLQGKPQVGEIIVFEAWTSEGFRQMMIHRIHEVTTDGKIFTKGDNVAKTDQEGGGWKPLSEEDIQGVIPEIAGHPLMIPKVGGVLYTYWLYLLIGGTALLIILYINGSKKLTKAQKRLEERRKRRTFSHRHKREIMYSTLFLIFSVLLMFLLSSGWQTGHLSYDVSDTSSSPTFGSWGSTLGVIHTGTEKTISLNFSNTLPIPMVTVIIPDDSNVVVSKNPLVLSQNDREKITLAVVGTTENIGRNDVRVNIITYPELFPTDMITKLLNINIPLALFCISCFPVGIITIIGYGLDRKYNRRKP